jgi:MSHA biogenesis protein MshI
LELDVIDIPELAMRNVSALLEEDIRGMAMLYFTDTSGVITLTHQSSLYLSRNLDVGMQQLAVEDEGQRLQALDRVVLEVQRSLDYFESHFNQGAISQLVIAPMTHDVPGMVSHFSANLGVAVRMLDMNDVLKCAEPIDMQTQARCFIAIGAALRIEQKDL